MNLTAALDTLRDDVATPAVRAVIERLSQDQAFQSRAQADLEAARTELAQATAAHDSERASVAAVHVRECELVAEAAPVPEFDTDGRAAISAVIESVIARFGPEVGEPHRGEHIEDRARLARPWALFASRYRTWSRTGDPTSEGLKLLAEASEWGDRIDAYVEAHPIPPRPEDSLARAVPRPTYEFIDLSLR